MSNDTKISRIVLLTVGILFVVILFIFQKNSNIDDQKVSLERPPNIPANIIGSLTQDQQKEVEAFKAVIFAKIESKASFNKIEKQTITSLIKTQNYIYQFSEEDISRIESAMAIN
ncbi:MAG: hypothetical protein Q8Q03_00925 [bacterium]|nr:hypothetical protein [bacterium]